MKDVILKQLWLYSHFAILDLISAAFEVAVGSKVNVQLTGQSGSS
jgi:hypothetical protein